MQLFGEETEHLGELGCHNVLGSISTCAFFKNLAEIQALSKVTGYSHLSRTSVGIIVSHMVIYLLRVMFPTGDIGVNIGKPFTLPDIKGKIEADQLKTMMDHVMGRIADLIPKEYHGVYHPTDGDSLGS